MASKRGVRTHTLKTLPEYFEAVRKRAKTFEVRRDDRPGGFGVGDQLILDEWDPIAEAHTGRRLTRTVTYLLPGGQFGIEAGFCVLGIE